VNEKSANGDEQRRENYLKNIYSERTLQKKPKFTASLIFRVGKGEEGDGTG